MSTANNTFIKSITSTFADDLTLTPLPDFQTPTISEPSLNSPTNFFTNITWQTWVIIILILALLGINIFAYLAKGTQETMNIFNQIFSPILQLFGYTTLETTKQTIETTATGTTAGVNAIANTSLNTINKVEQTVQNGGSASSPAFSPTFTPTSGTSVGVSTSNIPQGQLALSSQKGVSLSNSQQAEIEEWQQDSLEKALSDAASKVNNNSLVQPDDSRSSVQSAGKQGWCFIGEDAGIRNCAEIGVNDVCMSGDIFPSQEICMNPNLRP